MDKIWFALINGTKEGPYNVQELRLHPYLTPDTLVWKEGFAEWVPIRHVRELKDVFKDEPESKPLLESIKPKQLPSIDLMQDQATLAMQRDPSQLFLWLLIIILILLYIFYQLDRF